MKAIKRLGALVEDDAVIEPLSIPKDEIKLSKALQREQKKVAAMLNTMGYKFVKPFTIKK